MQGNVERQNKSGSDKKNNHKNKNGKFFFNWFWIYN